MALLPSSCAGNVNQSAVTLDAKKVAKGLYERRARDGLYPVRGEHAAQRCVPCFRRFPVNYERRIQRADGRVCFVARPYICHEQVLAHSSSQASSKRGVRVEQLLKPSPWKQFLQAKERDMLRGGCEHEKGRGDHRGW